MRDCIWLKAEAVGRFESLAWTGADHLRHTKFVAMRNDKDLKKVTRQTLPHIRIVPICKCVGICGPKATHSFQIGYDFLRPLGTRERRKARFF